MAVREVGGITTEARDLFARPLSASELRRFDAVVFDPPRAGARAQAEELAGSAVSVIAAVSCNPSTFARDARILAAGGYRLERVTPVDQFLWSPHLELVAIFRR
jgi:23S rRNA (uracil1939-C5)-methyltransferase